MAKKSVFDGMYIVPPSSAEELVPFEQHVLPQALAGDYEALTRVFFVCSEAVKHRWPLPPELAEFVAAGLRAMADGERPDDAWPVQRRRGQKNTSLAYNQAGTRAFKVEMKRQEGLTYEAAVLRVAEEECVSQHTVEAAWKKHHHKITRGPNGELSMWTGPDAVEEASGTGATTGG